MKCEICGGSGIKCKIECGMRWSLKAGTCQRKVCDYKVGCQDCNGSGIQPEVMSKSVIRRLAVQKPEQTEDEKIRDIFEDIKDYEGLYKINRHGDVLGLKRNKLLKQHNNAWEYKHVTLTKGSVCRNHRIHRLVAETFIPNPDMKPEVNHIDSDKSNNYDNNLEWVTSSENKKHAHKSGRMKQDGENNNASKLTIDDVVRIRELVKVISCSELGRIYNVTQQTISNIKNNKTWRA